METTVDNQGQVGHWITTDEGNQVFIPDSGEGDLGRVIAPSGLTVDKISTPLTQTFVHVAKELAAKGYMPKVETSRDLVISQYSKDTNTITLNAFKRRDPRILAHEYMHYLDYLSNRRISRGTRPIFLDEFNKLGSDATAGPWRIKESLIDAEDYLERLGSGDAKLGLSMEGVAMVMSEGTASEQDQAILAEKFPVTLETINETLMDLLKSKE